MALHLPLQQHQRRLSFKPCVRQTLTLLLGCTSIVSLTASVAFADYAPPNSSPSSATSSNGTRGIGACGEAPTGKLTALAPITHVGQTATTRPTFAWYVPDAEPHPIEFRLYKYNSNGKTTLIGTINSLQSKQGIMQYQLPSGETGLTIGQKYRWKVALICNVSSRSKDQILETDIAVVAMPATLQLSLANTSDRLQRASLYAKAGFWYDALAETLDTGKRQPYMITLLEDLVTLESETSKTVKEQHDRLKAVVKVERQSSVSLPVSN